MGNGDVDVFADGDVEARGGDLAGGDLASGDMAGAPHEPGSHDADHAARPAAIDRDERIALHDERELAATGEHAGWRAPGQRPGDVDEWTPEPRVEEVPADTPGTGAPEPVAAGTELAAAETGLTEREWRILAFERQWWRHAGAKEQAIRDEFGLSATRYYQMLNALLDKPAALEYEPVVVKRLRRLRATRTRTRARTARPT